MQHGRTEGAVEISTKSKIWILSGVNARHREPDVWNDAAQPSQRHYAVRFCKKASMQILPPLASTCLLLTASNSLMLNSDSQSVGK